MDLEKLFIDLGYKKEEYEKIRNDYSLQRTKEKTLFNNVIKMYNYLLKLGYTKEDIIKMTKAFPTIYSLSTENIKQKIEDMIDLGYEKEEVIKITKSLPTIYSYSIESIKQKMEDMIDLGYEKEEVIKITKSLPSIYSLSIENLKQKIEDLVELGYEKEEILEMTKNFPNIYSLSIENIKQKMEDMIYLGYTKEEVIKITKSLPSIYGYNTESIKQKIDFYDSINMHEVAVIRPKELIQSVELSYARYMFYKDENIDITMNNYQKLFEGQKRFEKKYGITKKELLQKYDYEEYMEKKKSL